MAGVSLYHASLGRYSDHSASEDDENTLNINYIQRDRRQRNVHDTDENSRADIVRGRPGSRRFRRHLNSVLSDYDSEYTDTEAEDEDLPIIRFEWDETFIKAGDYFFDENGHQNQTHVQKKKKQNRHVLKQRLIERQQKRKLHFQQKQEEQQHDTENKEEEIDGTEITDSTSLSSTNVIPGQEIASYLWREIDKNIRSQLRHVSHSELLEELEPLLIAYKNNEINALQIYKTKFATFDIIALPTQIQAKFQSGETKDTAPLAIIFKDSFGRVVCHACAAFHQLVSHSTDTKKDNGVRVTIIRQHKDGIFLQHTASFATQLNHLYVQRQARKNNNQFSTSPTTNVTHDTHNKAVRTRANIHTINSIPVAAAT